MSGSTGSEAPVRLSGATPRTDAEVEGFVGPAVRRTERLARNLALWICAPTLVGCALMLLRAAVVKGEDARAMAGGVVAAFLFMGLLPAYVVRRMVRADGGRLRRVVRDGAAYPASLVGRSATPSQTAIVVQWVEAGTERTAVVRMPGRAQRPEGAVTVMSSPDVRTWVAVELGSAGVHVGRRRR